MKKLLTSLLFFCSTALWAADYDLNVVSFRINGSEFNLKDSINCRVIFKNSGIATEPITSVCIKININGTTVHCDTLTSIAVGSTNFIYNKTIPHGLSQPIKGVEIKGEAYILDTDKEDADSTNNAKSKTFSVVGKLVERKVVIEEVTGFWCGYCPRAIVAMEYLSETYPDDFIGIAVHSGDVYHHDVYVAGLRGAYGSFKFPSAWANRTAACGTNKGAFEGSYFEQKEELTDVDPKVTAVYDEKTKEITATLETRFYSTSTNADYRGVFVLLENGIEGYHQANYLSGESDLGPFSGGGSYVSIPFNHIALAIHPSYSGTEGSIPAVIDYDVPYTYSETFAAPTNIKNLRNVEVVALVLDENGKIVNADKAKLITDATGIEGIDTEACTSTPRFFDLSGREIQAPQKGSIYIEQCADGKNVKRITK